MRLSTPRIAPLPEADWTEAHKELAAPFQKRYGRVFNVLTTLMRHMPLLQSWNGFATHIMGTSSLDPRHREMLIMRVAWATRSDYEWGQHVQMSAAAGMTQDDHERIKQGAGADGWTELEATLLRAADELLDDTMIETETWETLSDYLSAPQMIDVIFTVGQYNMLAMALNSLGVQREEGVPGF